MGKNQTSVIRSQMDNSRLIFAIEHAIVIPKLITISQESAPGHPRDETNH